MRIGFIGLGKLGMPVAVTIAHYGHDVLGYDQDISKLSKTNYPHKEVGLTFSEEFQPLLEKSNIKFTNTLEDIVEFAELIFVAIQTPHQKEYEGNDICPEIKKDFDYTYLENCLEQLVKLIKKEVAIAIISTVAPGTYKNNLHNILDKNKLISYVYDPFFIAMGQVIPDFINPEFVLLGSNDLNNKSVNKVCELYKTIHSKEIVKMSIESAEVTKMAYNTMIGLKITFVNNLMEMCHKIGGNVNDVTNTLKKATDRLISTKYLNAGQGDGGGCHSRDQIVLSHLCSKYNMSCDIPNMTIIAREKQAEWLTDLMIKHGGYLPKYILGRAFKPETNIETGSPAILCLNILKRKGYDVETYEPFSDGAIPNFRPSVFLIGCKHEIFKTIKFPAGSVVIDPHRYISNQENVKVIRVGENK